MSKILVTGAAGFIGGSISIGLKESGYDVYGIDYSRLPYLDNCFYMQAVGDYQKVLLPEFANHNFDAVVHCAATSLVSPSFEDPGTYYENNVSKTIMLLNWIKKYSPNTRFIFSSSASVYKTKNTPLKEGDKLEPLSPYAKSKKMIEDVVLDFAKAYGVKYTIFRYFNACGSIGSEHGQRPNATHILPRLFESAMRDEVFNLYGNCIRDYIHVKDLVKAHMLAIDSDKDGIFNLGSKTGMSNEQVLSEVEKALDKNINVVAHPQKQGDADILIADSSKAKKELNWEPNYNFDSIIKDLVKWYDSAHYKQLD